MSGTGIDAFTGTERFEALERLGAGSMCVVYKARDLSHGDVVALKTLRHLDSTSLYRLKQEFRALSSFDHPNLVSFYELFSEQSGWYVTMELVQGVDFLTFVRGDEYRRHQPTASTHGTSPGLATATVGKTGGSTWATNEVLRFSHSAPAGAAADTRNQTTDFRPLTDGRLPDLLKLRSGLRQLSEGVATLHEAGRIHRDLKPSNVLVTEAGRVVILDFGLVAEVDQDYTEGTLHQNIAGSAAYMSPEQAVGKSLSPASDWYAVGVMLYESLTGVWPFHGSIYEILTMKQELDPVPPKELLPGIPDDLNDLCVGLLRREPEDRPDAASILGVLKSRRRVDPGVSSTRFRFRRREREVLEGALAQAMAGTGALVVVRGPHGVGKTSLLRELVKTAKSAGAIALKGRCYEWEDMPFKALDGVMDNLTRALRRLDHRLVRPMASEQLPYLATVFPVLRRLDVLDLDTPLDLDRLDADDVAALAFAGLTQLLEGLSQQSPVLVIIDDTQWGDRRSGHILDLLLPRLEDERILVVLAHRDEPSDFLDKLRLDDATVVDIEPLGQDEASALAADLLGVSPHDPTVHDLVIASEGLPSRIRSAVRRLQASQITEDEVELTDVLISEIASLSETSRRLLELVAVADHPLATESVVLASGMGGDEIVDALSTLRAHQLIHTGDAGEGDTIQLVGESVRQYLLSQLDDERIRACHLALAEALEAVGSLESDAIVHHYAGGGQSGRAGVVAWLAARQALEAGRWSDASRLLGQALELGEWSADELRSMAGLRARSLAISARMLEAGRAFEAAAGLAPEAQRGPLLGQAVEQLLFGGDREYAEALANPILVGAGYSEVPSPRMAWTLTRARRAALWWRGDDVSERAEALLDEGDLVPLDVMSVLVRGFHHTSPSIAAAVQAQHLRAALDLGEPVRLVRARALEALVRAGEGEVVADPTSLVEAAEAVGDERLVGEVARIVACIHHHTGSIKDAEAFGDEAEQLLTRLDQSASSMLAARWATLWSLIWQGRLADARDRLMAPPRVTAGEGTFGQLFAPFDTLLHLAADHPDAIPDRVPAPSTPVGAAAFVSALLLARYRRETEAVEALIPDEEPDALTEGLDPMTRVEVLYVWGTSLLLLGRPADVLIPILDGLGPGGPFARLLEAHQTGDDLGLDQAARALHQAGFALLASAASRRSAQRTGNRKAERRVEAWLSACGIRNPPRLCRALLPRPKH